MGSTNPYLLTKGVLETGIDKKAPGKHDYLATSDGSPLDRLWIPSGSPLDPLSHVELKKNE